jgi:hypothetical protein
MLDLLDDIGVIGGQEAQDRLISFGFLAQTWTENVHSAVVQSVHSL